MVFSLIKLSECAKVRLDYNVQSRNLTLVHLVMKHAPKPGRWLVCLVLIILTFRVHGALDIFIECGDKIKGETKDSEFAAKAAIDVLAWSWGMSQSGTTHVGGGAGTGKPSFQDLSFTKYFDKATPALMSHLAIGTHIPTCTLTCRKAGATPQKYIEITMTDCLVTSLSTGGTSSEARHTENVTLNFAKVKVEYFLTNDKGVAVSAGSFTYDIANGTAE